jgi:hypothetical protein
MQSQAEMRTLPMLSANRSSVSTTPAAARLSLTTSLSPSATRTPPSRAATGAAPITV